MSLVFVIKELSRRLKLTKTTHLNINVIKLSIFIAILNNKVRQWNSRKLLSVYKKNKKSHNNKYFDILRLILSLNIEKTIHIISSICTSHRSNWHYHKYSAVCGTTWGVSLKVFGNTVAERYGISITCLVQFTMAIRLLLVLFLTLLAGLKN